MLADLRPPKLSSYVLFHSIQSKTEMEKFQDPISFQVACGEERTRKEATVPSRVENELIQKPLAGLVISIFVTVNYQRAGLYGIQFL